MDLDAHKKSLTTLLGQQEEQFRIPHYQRPYSWTFEQIDDLWDDLVENAADGHFLGSLVLAAEDESRPQVIDGQQRLTTLMMLLSVLRDACVDRGMSKDANRIQSRLTSDPFAEGDDYWKFKTGPANWPIFRDFVLREPVDPKRRTPNDIGILSTHQHDRNKPLLANLGRLRSHLQEELARHGEDGQAKWLSEFSVGLMKNVELVVIKVRHLADAFLLFETLNDRGLQLSAADLLKSHLLGQFAKSYAAGEQVDEAALEWDGLLEDLGADVDVSRFLRHYLLGYQQSVKKDEVFDHFKALIGKRDPQWVLDELRTVARLYGEFEQPSRVTHEPTREVLTDLRTLRAMTCYVALLPARRYLSEEDFVSFARLAEVLTFRYSTVVGLGTNELERRYRDAAQALIKSEGADLDTARRILIDTMPDSATFKAAFDRMRMGTQYLLRYTLRGIEAHLDQGKEKKFQPNHLVHIEHVMPQTLTDSWRKVLGMQGVERHSEFLNLYGNLTLFYYADNIPASNKPFAEKQTYYRTSDVILTEELAEVESWNLDAILARQDRLGRLADVVWAVPTARRTPVAGTSDSLERFQVAVGDLWLSVAQHCAEVPATVAQGWTSELPAHVHDHAHAGPRAAALAERLVTLVQGWEHYDAQQRSVLAGAVGYFLVTADAIHDEAVEGLVDDENVVAAAETVLEQGPRQA